MDKDIDSSPLADDTGPNADFTVDGEPALAEVLDDVGGYAVLVLAAGHF